MAELKPCPFCGGIPEVHTAQSGPFVGLTRVSHRCSIMGYLLIQDWTEGIEYAKRWNTRNDEAARQKGAEDAILKSGIMQLKIDSAVAVARKEEREACAELIDEFFEIYESDGVEFWLEYDAENGSEKIYKRFQDWKEKANAIRKRGEK